MSYVPVQAGSQSDVQENVNITFSSSNLKILLAVIAVAVVLYFCYQQMSGTTDNKENYETRSERMIAEARGKVKGRNNDIDDGDDDGLGEEDFSDLSDFSDISNLTEDMENFEKSRKGKKGKKAKKGKKGKKGKKAKKNLKENSEDSGDFFEPLSEENYNDSSVKQQVNEEEQREPHVEEQMQDNQMMGGMQPGGRMGPGMMGMDGMGSNQLAGIPEE
jgi:hypothetical protein